MAQIIIVIVLLLVGVIFGTLAEKKHYKKLLKNERWLNRIPAISSRIPPQEEYKQILVTGNVVIANDYFKMFVAGLKGLFGGSLNTYESLLDRGRREAIVRMKKNAATANAKLIVNVKLTTANLVMTQGNRSGALEVFAYGTALIPIEK